MVSFVTIQGSTNLPVTIRFDSNSNLVLAEQIATGINAGIKSGSIVTAYDTDGTPPPVPSSVSGALVQTQAGLAILPAGYTIDLVTKPGPAVVFGNGAPGETILSDVSTDLTFLATSGSGTVVAGGGNNRVSVGGSGNWSLYTGGGTDVIAALGTVNATIGAGDGNNSILLGVGSDLILSTGKDTVVGGRVPQPSMPAGRAATSFRAMTFICSSLAVQAGRRSWVATAATHTSGRPDTLINS